jgi:hypothetical protein
MALKYCRINLSKTNYIQSNNWIYLPTPNVDQLNEIYKKYCKHKKFNSVMPLFENHYKNPIVEIIGYTNKDKIVAFSLTTILDKENCEGTQFAWDYENPELYLGIQSLKNECAIYKDRGFKYYYLGTADKYKEQIDGYEILGTL